MAELYVKPGNRQRGWNDPPQFSYGLQQLRGRRGGGAPRGLLARRTAPGPAGAATGEAFAGAAPPPALGPVGPPPLPPQTVSWPPSLPGTSLRADATKPLSSDAGEECEAEDVLSALNEALDECRGSVQKQVCDEISKRLAILQQMWVQDKLSAPVRRGMWILTQELKAQCWDTADEIHRSLMVDHITEVSQWMVGIKRLIAEAKDLHAGDMTTDDPEQKVEASSEPEDQ